MTTRLKQLLFLFLLTTAFSVAYFLNVQKLTEAHEREKAVELQKEQVRIDAYKDMNLEAASAIVFDFTNQKILYGFREDVSRPLASITKIMTAILAVDAIDPKETVTISNKALAEEGENNLLSGEVWDSRELMKFMLVVSSNDAAASLAETVEKKRKYNQNTTESFIGSMNRVAREIGAEKTVFYNPSGLDLDQENPGAIGSARDVAKFVAFTYARNPELYLPTTKSETRFVSRSGFIHQAKNTNGDVETLPGIVLSKTGLTDLAGGNLAIVAMIGGRPYVLVVLGSTEKGRFSDMQVLLSRTRQLILSGVYLE